MRLRSPFNLNEFFEKGFTVNNIDSTQADTLLASLKKETFVRPEDVFGGDIYEQNDKVTEPTFNLHLKKALAWDWKDKKHPLIWEKGMNGKDDPNLFTSYPQEFQSFWNDLVDSKDFQWFTNTYGRFSRFGMLAHRYEVGQGLGWHHDLSDATWINCILYLGDREYTTEDGGYLSIGRCRLDSEGIPIIPRDKAFIQVDRFVPPQHGTIVFMDNRRANLLHRVPILERQRERYTLSCQLGYIENMMAKKFKKAHD